MGNAFHNAGYLDMSFPYAAGAMYSTVEDLYLWDQALYTEKLLPKKYMDLVFGTHIPSGKNHYGYGWSIGEMPIGNTKDKLQITEHGGGINGFATLITRIPSNTALIVLLNNTERAPLYEMTMAINGILYHKSYDLPKKSVANSVLTAIEKEGITTALSYYKKIKDSSDYYLDEREINGAGYSLLQSNKPKEAASVFKLNVEAFPNSANVYDNYGEALLASGNKIEAIENYKRSVQLNPGSTNGIKILKELGVNVNTDTLVKKVSVEYLKLLEGEYITESQGEWRIKLAEVKGELTGNDGGYRYK